MYLHEVLDGVGVMVKLVTVLVNWLEMVPITFVKIGVDITEKKFLKFIIIHEQFSQ
jgi:hypothetical protein